MDAVKSPPLCVLSHTHTHTHRHASSGRVSSKYSADVAFSKMSYTNFREEVLQVFSQRRNEVISTISVVQQRR